MALNVVWEDTGNVVWENTDDVIWFDWGVPDADASRWTANIKKSMERYIQDNLSSGVSVSYEGMPFESGSTTVASFIRGDLGQIVHPSSHPKASSSMRGGMTSLSYSLMTFVKKTGVTSADEHYRLRDLVENSFYSGSTIPLRDYASGVTFPVFGNLEVRRIERDEPDRDKDFLIWDFTIEGVYLEVWPG